MNTKPILVHVHIFYPELWPELKQHIQNIPPHPFKLFVTLSQQHPTLIQDIKASFPDSQIEIVPNRGFDVGPFMHILNQINLDDYSYIIKLHTKRNCYINTPIFRNMIGNIWRKNLLQFIKDQPSFKQSLDFLATHPKVGMLSSYKSIVKDDHYDAIAAKELKKFLKQHHWPKIKFAFVAGTMFIARANLFKPLQQLHISINDFAEVKGAHTSQLAHIFERLFGYIIYQQGYTLEDHITPHKMQKQYHNGLKYSTLWKKLKKNFFQYKRTASGKYRLKILKLPIPECIIKYPLKLFHVLFGKHRTISGQLKIKIFGIPFVLPLHQSLKQRIEYLEKSIIAQSPWWDALWYVREYDHHFSRQEALDYWYHTGWKQGEAPSPYLHLAYNQKLCGAINPIIYYMSPINHTQLTPDRQNNFKSPHDSAAIAQYLQYRASRQAKSVIYTCITNDYDDIREILAYKYINPDWDYVCFTDNQADIAAKQIGIWEIRPLQFTSLDSSRNNRWHKTHPHLLFPEYAESIYIDGNINILSDFLFRTIRQKNQDFILPRHQSNLCIYQEYQTVLAAELDKPELILAERDLIEKDGMPYNYGFTENNILYRRHHQAEVISLMDEWWNMIENYAKRDQLSLVYLLWKHHIRIEDITFENSRLLTNDFYVFGHKKGRK